jgi:3-oxoacyl-[acyl-carrier-protein] synthase-1
LTSESLAADAVVCGLGAVSCVGRDALSTAAAVRAGVSGFVRHPVMADVEGRPVQVAMCPWMHHRVPAAQRMIEALRSAVAESMRVISGAANQAKIGLLVNLPPQRPGLPVDVAAYAQTELTRAFPKRFSRIACAQRGHAGVLMAVASALASLRDGSMDACVVCGTDSYMNLETLEWLEETEQFHGTGARNNAWGFVPGEAAGALLVTLAPIAERLGLKPIARVLSVGLGTEEHLIRTESVCLGRGVTTAFRQALAPLPEDVRITDVFCDMNGEPYRADEYGFAITRTRERFESPSEFIAPADCLGDVGAASGAMLLVLATLAQRKGYARGPLALVWASSDAGERGAALLGQV